MDSLTLVIEFQLPEGQCAPPISPMITVGADGFGLLGLLGCMMVVGEIPNETIGSAGLTLIADILEAKEAAGEDGAVSLAWETCNGWETEVV